MKIYKLFQYSKYIAVSFLLSLTGFSVQAIEVADGFNITPFLSQSMVHTTDNNFHGHSDDSVSLRSNEIGAVFQYQPNSKWLLATQLMARNAGEMDDGDPRVDYLFAQYRFFENLDNSYSFKIGKLRLPYGFYNETRDVAATNPGFILPQSIYIDRGRNTFYSANGASFHGEHYWNMHSLTWDIGTAEIEPDDDEMDDLAGFPAGNGDGTYNGFARIMYSFNQGQFKTALSYRKSDFDFVPEIGLDIEEGNIKTDGYLLSLQYNTEKWTWTAEWMRSDTEVGFTAQNVSVQAPPPAPPGFFVDVDIPVSFKFPSEGYYLQAQYRFHPKFTLLMRHGQTYANRDDKKGEETVANINEQIALFPQLAPLARTSFSQYARDSVLGLTWNISPNMITRIEWHDVEGTFWLSSADNPESGDTKKFWDIVAVQFAYRF